MKRILILITLLFATQQANASFVDGNRLKKQIDSCATLTDPFSPTQENAKKNNDCEFRVGYIAGVYDAYKGAGSLSRCIPDNLTLGQLTAVVENWLKSNPEDWHFNANSLVLLAIKEAWPCPE